MPKIFISYRREDSEHITGRIYDRLESHFGRDKVFMDIDSIPFGVDFREHLDQAVGRCDVLLAIIGERWLDVRVPKGPTDGGRRLDDPTDFVRIEIQAALARRIPVIPVLVGKGVMPGPQALPEGLRNFSYRNAAEVRAGRDFRDHVDRLIRGIERLPRPKEAETGRKVAPPRPPVAPAGEKPPKPPLVLPAANPATDAFKGPVIALHVFGLMAPLGGILAVWDFDSFKMSSLLVCLTMFGSVVSGAAAAIGGDRMRRRNGFVECVRCCVLVMLPIHVLFIVGLPLGIWALTTLYRPGVRETFTS